MSPAEQFAKKMNDAITTKPQSFPANNNPVASVDANGWLALVNTTMSAADAIKLAAWITATFGMLSLFILTSCGHNPAPDPSPVKFPIPIADAIARFHSMSDAGWVVSRWDDGRIEHAGDSLIWTGVAMAALPCADGDEAEAALQTMLQETGGRLYRHPTLKDEWSLDGAIGLYYGVDARVKRCGKSDTWGPLLKAHADMVELPPFFDVLRQQVMADAGVATAPSPERRGLVGAEMAGWAVAVVSQRAAAYRLHLAFLTLKVVDAPNGKAGFCGAVQKAAMPILEHFCGRGALADWAEKFEYDRWEYALQRAAWETETVDPGLHTPALDYLHAAALLSQ